MHEAGEGGHTPSLAGGQVTKWRKAPPLRIASHQVRMPVRGEEYGELFAPNGGHTGWIREETEEGGQAPFPTVTALIKDNAEANV